MYLELLSYESKGCHMLYNVYTIVFLTYNIQANIRYTFYRQMTDISKYNILKI